MDFLKIDGSYGEGGGQIVRSAVTLSCITNKPVQIENIRKNRKVPGLRPQHLIGIKLLSKICNADVEGLEIGSSTIKFIPNEVENSSLNENIGTAGSISLILQVFYCFRCEPTSGDPFLQRYDMSFKLVYSILFSGIMSVSPVLILC